MAQEYFFGCWWCAWCTDENELPYCSHCTLMLSLIWKDIFKNKDLVVKDLGPDFNVAYSIAIKVINSKSEL